VRVLLVRVVALFLTRTQQWPIQIPQYVSCYALGPTCLIYQYQIVKSCISATPIRPTKLRNPPPNSSLTQVIFGSEQEVHRELFQSDDEEIHGGEAGETESTAGPGEY
jgi:hypothetical protein